MTETTNQIIDTLMSKSLATNPSASEVAAALSDLKTAILSLKPEREDGFEGFLADILNAHTKRVVELSKTGYQFGQDALSLSPETIIAIEAKLYKNKLPADTVLAKIPQFMDQTTPPDLWILGASSPAGTRIAKTLHSVSAQTGIAMALLDWPDNTNAPPLASYCLLAPERAQAFLIAHGQAADLKTSLPPVFETLKNSETLKIASRRLASELSAPSIGLAFAKDANADWLSDKLASKDKARAYFGQRLSPNADAALPLQLRHSLNQSIAQHVFTSAPGGPMFLIGGQGHGKSWAMMNAWSAADGPPLFVTLTANAAAKLADQPHVQDTFIATCLQQTGATYRELARPKWERRLARWRAETKPELPRFILYLDGLNQRADADWVQIINALHVFCEECGGQLVISIRPTLFNRLKNRFPESTGSIKVPVWSRAELSDILHAAGLEMEDLSGGVIDTLRVPRMCALAFELRQRGVIADFQDLTVGRLLHEQIKSGEDTSLVPADFQKEIEIHARETLQRYQSQHPEPKLFEAGLAKLPTLHDRLQLLCQDGYFSSSAGDEASYEIRQETFTLGLAVWIIRRLRGEHRKKGDLDLACADLIEPIQAVDQTASIVLDALILAAVDPDCPDGIVKVLISTFAHLQNVESDAYPAFCAASLARPSIFLSALADMSARAHSSFNHDWLLGAAAHLATNAQTNPILATFLSDCLQRYSLSPRLGAHGRSGNNPTEDDIQKQQNKIDERLSNLTDYERSLLNSMIETPDMVSYALIDDALRLLKLFDLERFADAFTKYVLASCINAPVFHRREDFTHLVRFNSLDWGPTRNALLKQVDALQAEGPSVVGKWAMILLLEATGHPNDAARAEDCREPLHDASIRKHRRNRASEKKVNPFDPDETVDVAHLKEVRTRLGNIGLENWRRGRDNTIENHAIAEHLPYLARFAPKDAVAFQRKLAEEALGREGLPLRMAVYDLVPELAALSSKQKSEMVEKALGIIIDPDKKENEDWVTQQYLMLMGITAEPGAAQLQAVSQLPRHLSILTKFDDVFDAPPPETVECALQESIEASGHNGIVTMLRFVSRCGTTMTAQTLAHCEDLISHESTVVRAFSMDAIIASEDRAAIERFAESGWSAKDLDPKGLYFERWYGGHLLIAATRLGHLQPIQLITRITPAHFPWAIRDIGVDFAPLMVDVLNNAMSIQLTSGDAEEPPLISRSLASASDRGMVFVSLDDRPKPAADAMESFRQAAETDEAFQARQRARSNAYNDFLHSMTEQGAENLLGDIGFSTIEACMDSHPNQVEAWAERILMAEPWTRRALKASGMHIARVLSSTKPKLARKLFLKLLKTDAFVRLQSGASKLDYDGIALWHGSAAPDIAASCFERLDHCTDDEGLFREVLTARFAGRDKLLDRYIEIRLESGHPMSMSRALMVAGLKGGLDQHVERYVEAAGPVGVAARKALDIQRQYSWMHYWWRQMVAAQTNEAFWQSSLLFRQCLDGRFDLETTYPVAGSVADLHLPLLDQDIRRSIERSGQALSKTLFGSPPPSDWLVKGPS